MHNRIFCLILLLLIFLLTGCSDMLNYFLSDDDNSFMELVKLTASDAEDSDEFAYSVAMSGDYVLIGAPYEDETGINSGAAYVYGRNDGGANNWGESAKLTASDAEDNNLFGCSVAMYGDNALVGSLNENGAGTARGAAYIFEMR